MAGKKHAPGMLVHLSLVPILLFASGCPNLPMRPSSEDDIEKEKFEIGTIGDITTVAHAEPIVIGGVGLVVGLDGTGGDAPPSDYRKKLEEQLVKQGIDNPRKLLASRDNSMVIVQALIPPGIHKGDPIDVEVSLPPESKTSSLRGGYLKECILYNYDTTSRLSGGPVKEDCWLRGHPLARAAGPIIGRQGDRETGRQGDRETGRQGDRETGRQGDRENETGGILSPCLPVSLSPCLGRVWGGGQCNIDRRFSLVLNDGKQFCLVAKEVADRINETLHGPADGPNGGAVATARNKAEIELDVPPRYRHNMPRYLRVVRLIPLVDGGDRPAAERNRIFPRSRVSAAVKTSEVLNYRRRLEEICSTRHAP